MPEQKTDVKTGEGSSSSSEANATATQDKVATQSDQGVKEPESMAEVAAQVAKAHGIGEEKAGSTKEGEKVVEGEKAESAKETDKEGETEKEEVLPDEKKQEEEEQGKEEDKGKDEPKPGQAVPYDRFKAVNEKAKTYEAKVQELEPVAKSHHEIVKFCKANGITQAQFSDGLKLMSLVNSNPAEAVKHLTGLVEQLQGFVGDKLPEDLQKKVDAGVLEVEDAKEIASLRAKTKHIETRSKQTAEQTEKAAEEKFFREVHVATANWEQSKAKTDPDMREGTQKYQLVLDKFRALSDEKKEDGSFANPVQTVQDYVKLLDTAYAFVEGFVKKLTKANNSHRPQRVLSSTGSSVTAEVEPKSMQDIAKQVGAKHGISI